MALAPIIPNASLPKSYSLPLSSNRPTSLIGFVDNFNLFNCFQFSGACASIKCPILLRTFVPIGSSSSNTLKPSGVLPFLK